MYHIYVCTGRDSNCMVVGRHDDGESWWKGKPRKCNKWSKATMVSYLFAHILYINCTVQREISTEVWTRPFFFLCSMLQVILLAQGQNRVFSSTVSLPLQLDGLRIWKIHAWLLFRGMRGSLITNPCCFCLWELQKSFPARKRPEWHAQQFAEIFTK